MSATVGWDGPPPPADRAVRFRTEVIRYPDGRLVTIDPDDPGQVHRARTLGSPVETCRVRDDDGHGRIRGECTLPVGHVGVIHTEMRDGRMWAQWRSVLPVDECVCHARPGACPVHVRPRP